MPKVAVPAPPLVLPQMRTRSEIPAHPKGRPWRLQAAAFCALALILANLGPVAVAGISVYRKSIAPALGIHCAYAHATGAESCSAYTKRIIAAQGFYAGLPACIRRFQACAKAGKGLTP